MSSEYFEDEGPTFYCYECGHNTHFSEDEYESAEEIACERCGTPVGP